jgi:hypothetical protein
MPKKAGAAVNNGTLRRFSDRCVDYGSDTALGGGGHEGLVWAVRPAEVQVRRRPGRAVSPSQSCLGPITGVLRGHGLRGPAERMAVGGIAAVSTSSPDDLDTGSPAPGTTTGRHRR